ncbi:hypothetical protein [Sorangium sp. So ce1078]|uniref:hypothetical protein n=1 Tax=Sorangium sp. So ce1078 TaxID=3133329 RepID=UPI003F62E296
MPFTAIECTGEIGALTKTASYLIELVRAIRLLGAEGVITGIRSNVAQTMIALGLGLSGIITMGNLRAGLKLCIQRMNAGADAVTADGAAASRPVPGTGTEPSEDRRGEEGSPSLVHRARRRSSDF